MERATLGARAKVRKGQSSKGDEAVDGKHTEKSAILQEIPHITCSMRRITLAFLPVFTPLSNTEFPSLCLFSVFCRRCD